MFNKSSLTRFQYDGNLKSIHTIPVMFFVWFNYMIFMLFMNAFFREILH